MLTDHFETKAWSCPTEALRACSHVDSLDFRTVRDQSKFPTFLRGGLRALGSGFMMLACGMFRMIRVSLISMAVYHHLLLVHFRASHRSELSFFLSLSHGRPECLSSLLADRYVDGSIPLDDF